MAKRRKATVDESFTSFDMTPMIDCVFQLIIFFMLVTDMSQQQFEPVRLPAASEAFEEDNVHEDEMVVNIMGRDPESGNMWFYQDSSVNPPEVHLEIRVNGQVRDIGWLENHFRTRRSLERYWEVPGGRTVAYPMLVRADREAYWMEVQRVMMMATRYGGVYKVALAGRIPQS